MHAAWTVEARIDRMTFLMREARRARRPQWVERGGRIRASSQGKTPSHLTEPRKYLISDRVRQRRARVSLSE